MSKLGDTIHETSHYQVIVGPAPNDAPGDTSYHIVNKTTDVVEMDIPIYLQAISYCDQLSEDLDKHIAEKKEEKGDKVVKIATPYEH